MTPPPSRRSDNDSLKEALILVFLAVLIALSKVTFRFPLKLSGHTMIWIIFLMCVGRALTSRPWAGCFMGIAAGLISLALGGGVKSLSYFAQYSLAGLIIDVLFRVSDPLPTGRWWLLALWGGLAALSRSSIILTTDIIAGADFWVAVAMNIPKALMGTGFGVIGALLAYQLIKALARHGHTAYKTIGPTKAG